MGIRVLPQIHNLRLVAEGDREFWAAELQVGTLTIPVDCRYGAWFAADGGKDLVADVATMLAERVRQAERKIRRAATA